MKSIAKIISVILTAQSYANPFLFAVNTNIPRNCEPPEYMGTAHLTIIPFILNCPLRHGISIPNPHDSKNAFLFSSSRFPRLKNIHYAIRAAAKVDENAGDKFNQFSNTFGADKVLRLIAGATASPIGQYVSSPFTFLHAVDARIKLVWLLVLVVLPARSHISMRLGLVLFIALLSVCVLPKQLSKDQLGRVTLLCGILFIMLALGSDGSPPLDTSRTPPVSLLELPSLPSSSSGYSYLIFKLGPLQFTRKSLSVASKAACLTFVIFQSASLCLATTTPENLAFALRWFLLPFKRVGVPVSEITLTLLLSLRFINLVFDEVRNVALGIISRRINWKEVVFMEVIEIFAGYIRRIFKNIFTHSEQISQAMIVRGFRGDSETHKIHFMSKTSSGFVDFASLLCLFGVIGGSCVINRLIY